MQIKIENLLHPTLEGYYIRSIENVINAILRTQTGRTVVKHIELASRQVTIIPDYKHSDNPSAGRTENSNILSPSVIRFTVGRHRGHGPQSSSDEVLLHEMTHALRQVTGAQPLGTIPRIASFNNVEEFYAITITGVHSSELGRTLRGNHGIWPLRNPGILRVPPFSTRLRQMCDTMPIFTREMAMISPHVAPFNPFRDIHFNTI